MAQVRIGPVVNSPGPLAFRAALLLACLSGAPAAWAWGSQGHRITALVADTLITARTRASVSELTGATSLVDLVNWADEYRPGLKLLLDHSDRWHYDDHPVCDTAALPSSYCADGQCASAALARLEFTLANRAATADQRGIALRFIVHVLGDVHQPLHTTDNNDEGGSKRNVALPGAPPHHLHAIWDTDLLQPMLRGMNDVAYADALREWYDTDIDDWQQGTVSEWMTESYAIGQAVTYGALPGFQCGLTRRFVTPLTQDYVREAQAQIGRQLARAGARIAVTLNRALDP